MSEFNYIGSELDIFEQARRWKSYWKSRIQPFVREDVLEVGAGIGANTTALSGLRFRSWLCLEPDPTLAERISVPAGRGYEVMIGTLRTLPDDRLFDTILYVDVLEHIEDDQLEMSRAASRLKPGGTLIVLAPAHSFLYTPFDRAIGHFRRYDGRALRGVAPNCLREERIEYLDSAGMLASLGNRLLLKSPTPTPRQIRIWDSLMVPCSRLLDPLLCRRLGKSVLGVWNKE